MSRLAVLSQSCNISSKLVTRSRNIIELQFDCKSKKSNNNIVTPS